MTLQRIAQNVTLGNFSSTRSMRAAFSKLAPTAIVKLAACRKQKQVGLTYEMLISTLDIKRGRYEHENLVTATGAYA